VLNKIKDSKNIIVIYGESSIVNLFELIEKILNENNTTFFKILNCYNILLYKLQILPI